MYLNLKASIVIFCYFVFCSLLNAQMSDNDIKKSTEVIGKNLKTNKEIIAKIYTFPYHITKFSVDTADFGINMRFQKISKNKKYYVKKGQYGRLNTQEDNFDWTKNASSINGNIEQRNGSFYYYDEQSTIFINQKTGIENWETKNDIYYTNNNYGICMGYKRSSLAVSNTLNGLNVSNGKKQWTREIPREYGWNHIYDLKDSTILVVSSGLHRINTYTGKGWSFNTETGDSKINKAAVVTTVGGVALGLLTGVFVYNTNMSNKIYNIASNVVFDTNFMYFASREHITCVNNNGEIFWRENLGDNFGSKADIFLQDTVLYVINSGLANMNGRSIEYGMPYIAAYGQKSGVKIYESILGSTKNDQIIHSKVEKENLILIRPDKLERYELKTGKFVNDKKFNPADSVNLRYFINKNFYELNSKNQYEIIVSDSSLYHIYTEGNEIFHFNKNFELVGKTGQNEYSLNYATFNGYKFLTKGEDKTVVINAKDEIILELDATNRSYFHNGKMAIVKENTVKIIDLKGDL
jgi:hypothetical protein